MLVSGRDFYVPWFAEHTAAVELAVVAAVLAVVMAVAFALWTFPPHQRSVTWQQWDRDQWVSVPDALADRLEKGFQQGLKETDFMWGGRGPWNVNFRTMMLNGYGENGRVRQTPLRRVPTGKVSSAGVSDYGKFIDPSLEERGRREPGRTRLLFACESPKSTLWDVEFVVEDILAKGFPALNVVAELDRYPLGPYAPEQFTLEEEAVRLAGSSGSVDLDVVKWSVGSYAYPPLTEAAD